MNSVRKLLKEEDALNFARILEEQEKQKLKLEGGNIFDTLATGYGKIKQGYAAVSPLCDLPPRVKTLVRMMVYLVLIFNYFVLSSGSLSINSVAESNDFMEFVLVFLDFISVRDILQTYFTVEGEAGASAFLYQVGRSLINFGSGLAGWNDTIVIGTILKEGFKTYLGLELILQFACIIMTLVWRAVSYLGYSIKQILTKYPSLVVAAVSFLTGAAAVYKLKMD